MRTPSRNPYFNGGRTEAKRHPRFVYSRRGFLVHEVQSIEFDWYDRTCCDKTRRKDPRTIYHTVCGMMFYMGREQTCAIPDKDAVLCKACRGEGKNFPKGAAHEISKPDARNRLGCAAEVVG